MNTDKAVVIVMGTPFSRDEEYRVADRAATRPKLPEASNPQRETPCSCPHCFPMWD